MARELHTVLARLVTTDESMWLIFSRSVLRSAFESVAGWNSGLLAGCGAAKRSTFRAEFIDREADFIASGGRLIFPLPALDIYPPLEEMMDAANG